MLQKDRLDGLTSSLSGGWQPNYGNSWVSGGAGGALLGWGGWSAFSGMSFEFSFLGGLALSPFARSSCDTPTGHRNTNNTSSNTSTPPRPKPVDPELDV
ncbi:hypothetical protein [Kitasatospora sp. NPDC091207]|uniref:hypothetical protein n=1 Tax=Kitasatospora sp. NPDC091207 TaxID=3364083 RepID=UPI00380EE5CC